MNSMPSEKSQRQQSLPDDAKISPSSVYDHPHQVVQSHVLTTKQKADILEQWEADAIAMQQASDEGMIGVTPSRLEDIHNAQSELHDVTAGRGASTATGPQRRHAAQAAPSQSQGGEALIAEFAPTDGAGKNVRTAFVIALLAVFVALLLLGRFLAGF